MNNQFTNDELSKINLVTDSKQYMYRQGNNATVFMFTYFDDDQPSFILTKNNGSFTLTQFDNTGISTVILKNVNSLKTIISKFKSIVSE